jgi:hypothetical protein
MNTPTSKYVTQGRAAVLLGLSVQELERISHESGFGHRESIGGHDEVFFTYEELRKICQITTYSVH